MDFIIYFCICICAIIIFALYIRKIIKPYKQKEKIESDPLPLEIKTEFETVKFQAEIVNLTCRVEMVGIKTPKSVEIYTVEFKTDEEPNIILKTGGRKGGATGTRKNIKYGAHLGDNKTWKEADNQKSG